MKARFVVGPPGTGKTYKWIVKRYKKLLKKYVPQDIVLLSHTNEAVRQILNAVMSIKDAEGKTLKEKGYDEDFFEHRICTLHHYCKHKLMRREVFTAEEDPDGFAALCQKNTGFKISKEKTIKKHPFFKFVKHARGNGKTLREYWNLKSTEIQEYSPYNIDQLENLNETYENYKRENGLYDFADMIDEYNLIYSNKENPNSKESTIKALIIDEAQDSNVPQMVAIGKMAKNVKEGHFYLVGDPDQTIFEFAGSDAHFFHEAAKNPYEELKEGLRCGEAINKFCKEIIAPVWRDYGYTREWSPAKYAKDHEERKLIPEDCKIGDIIKGNKYELTDLNPSKNLNILLDKMRNTKQTFLFAYRGWQSSIGITELLKKHGFEFAHIKSQAHVSKKEINWHAEWPKFIGGGVKHLDEIKGKYWKYLSKEAKVYGKGDYKFEGWIKKDYSYKELIEAKLLKPNLGTNFALLITTQKDHDNRMIYIKNVVRKGFNPEDNIRIKYGSIHDVKGATFDNVVGDLTLYRMKPEHFYVQRRLVYTMFSRGIFDCWVLRSQTGRELGNYGPVPLRKPWSIDEDSFYRRWRPDWNEIENPDDNDRRKIFLKHEM